MVQFRLAIVLITIMVTSGCVSLNRGECEMANWRALGFEQGSRGHTTASYKNYQNECVKHGIKADFDTYMTGYREGLDTYCTLENGLNTGKRGADYNTNCAGSRFPEFANGYTKGLSRYCTYDNGYRGGLKSRASNTNCSSEDHPEYGLGFEDGAYKRALEKSISELTEELASINQHIAETQLNIVAAEQVIISESGTSALRKDALKEIKLQGKRHRELNKEYNILEPKLMEMKNKYHAL